MAAPPDGAECNAGCAAAPPPPAGRPPPPPPEGCGAPPPPPPPPGCPPPPPPPIPPPPPKPRANNSDEVRDIREQRLQMTAIFQDRRFIVRLSDGMFCKCSWRLLVNQLR